MHNTPESLTELLVAVLHCGSRRRHIWNQKDDISGSATLILINYPVMILPVAFSLSATDFF